MSTLVIVSKFNAGRRMQEKIEAGTAVKVDLRDAEKPKTCVTALPPDCVGVLVLGGCLFASQLRDMARKADIPYVATASPAQALEELYSKAIIQPPAPAPPPAPVELPGQTLRVLLVGDLTKAEQQIIGNCLAGIETIRYDKATRFKKVGTLSLPSPGSLRGSNESAPHDLILAITDRMGGRALMRKVITTLENYPVKKGWDPAKFMVRCLYREAITPLYLSKILTVGAALPAPAPAPKAVKLLPMRWFDTNPNDGRTYRYERERPTQDAPVRVFCARHDVEIGTDGAPCEKCSLEKLEASRAALKPPTPPPGPPPAEGEVSQIIEMREQLLEWERLDGERKAEIARLTAALERAAPHAGGETAPVPQGWGQALQRFACTLLDNWAGGETVPEVAGVFDYAEQLTTEYFKRLARRGKTIPEESNG